MPGENTSRHEENTQTVLSVILTLSDSSSVVFKVGKNWLTWQF